jgi:hypothetical protein
MIPIFIRSTVIQKLYLSGLIFLSHMKLKNWLQLNYMMYRLNPHLKLLVIMSKITHGKTWLLVIFYRVFDINDS